MFQVNLALRLPAKGQMMQPPVDCHGTLLDLSLDDLVGGYENRGANPPSFTKYSPHMPESRKSKQTLHQIDQTLFKIQMSNAIQCQGDINWYHAKILEFLFVSQCFSCFCFSTSRRLSVVALSCVFHQGILQGFQPLPAWRWPNSRMAPSNWSWLELYTLHFAKVEVSDILCINIILYIYNIDLFIYLLIYLFCLYI